MKCLVLTLLLLSQVAYPKTGRKDWINTCEYSTGTSEKTFVALRMNSNLSHDNLSCEKIFHKLRRAKNLTITGQGLSDLSPLKIGKKLKYLNLSQNEIEDVYPLSHLTNLVELSLAENKIDGIGPLRSLPHLEKINLSGNPVVYFSDIEKVFARRGTSKQSNEKQKFLQRLYHRVGGRQTGLCAGIVYLLSGAGRDSE